MCIKCAVTFSDIIRRETWFTQDDVNALVSNGINTVRIPVRVVQMPLLIPRAEVNSCQLGYWVIEPLVDRRTEFYPRGGIRQLARFLTLQFYFFSSTATLVATWFEPAQGRWDQRHSRPPCSSGCANSASLLRRQLHDRSSVLRQWFSVVLSIAEASGTDGFSRRLPTTNVRSPGLRS